MTTTAFLAGSALLAGAALAQTSWDADGDGAVGVQEFLAGFAPMGTFAGFDANGNATLDAEEWEAGLTDVGSFPNMDLNGDGGVDEAEYNALLFNRYDSDGSGVIEAGEMAQVDSDMAAGGMLAG